MSFVTDVMIVLPAMYESVQVSYLAALNILLAEHTPALPLFSSLTADGAECWGGDKYPHLDVWAASINHLDLEADLLPILLTWLTNPPEGLDADEQMKTSRLQVLVHQEQTCGFSVFELGSFSPRTRSISSSRREDTAPLHWVCVLHRNGMPLYSVQVDD